VAGDVEILHITAFPVIVPPAGTRTGALFIDSDSLIKLQKTDGLNALLAANRLIYITREVLDDAVTKGLGSSNPTVVASAQIIDRWIQDNVALGNVTTQPVDPTRSLITGSNAGELSIISDVAFLAGEHSPIVVSDDNLVALRYVGGSEIPALTTNYFLNSLVTAGAITPNEYFKIVDVGGSVGFNQKVFPEDNNPTLIRNVQYDLTINDVPGGTFELRTVGSSKITVDGQSLYLHRTKKQDSAMGS